MGRLPLIQILMISFPGTWKNAYFEEDVATEEIFTGFLMTHQHS